MACIDSNDATRSYIQLARDSLIGHYRIVERIGVGGMGEVYHAYDDLLERPVAVKFLSVQASADERYRRRFLREARAAARLRHPNIVLTLDIGEYRGLPFIVFEYLGPRTLRQRVKAGPLDIGEILKIGSGVADAVGAAHLQSVVHRDIKPSNILLTDGGEPKLVDFGLAVVSDVDTDTRSVGIVGTIGYMSPEQARGMDVDERTDFFSLGVVIYEMVTGVNPFRCESQVSSLHALLNEDVCPMRRYRDDVPGRLDDIVAALLQKDPGARYQCAEHLRDDLRLCLSGGTVARPLRTASCVVDNRVAVFSFESLMHDATEERTGEMLAHLVITGLSDVPEISVVSEQRILDLLTLEGRRDARRVERPVATRLARRAEARWMLMGTILGCTPFALTMQLVDVATGLQLKGHRLVLEDDQTIFDAADTILARLREDLSQGRDRPITSPIPLSSLTTESPEALRHFLLGFDWQMRWSEEQAKAEYEKAIERDPMFAMAYYGLASIPVPDRLKLIDKAEQLARRATFRERCYIRALQHRLHGHREKSMKVLRELIERHSDEKLAYHWLGVNLHYLGQYEEAIACLRKAIELDPLYKPAYNQLVYTLNRAGQFEESVITANQMIQLAPDQSNPYDTRAEILGFNGRLEAALASYREALVREPILPPSLERAGILYVFKQDYANALALFDRLTEFVASSPWVDPHVSRVTVPLRQGRWREALAYLDLAIAEDAAIPGREVHVGFKRDLKATIFLQMGMFEEALVEAEGAIQILEKDVWYWRGIDPQMLRAWALAAMGHREDARETLEKHCRPEEDRGHFVRMTYLLGLGLVESQGGDVRQAVAWLEEADSVKPRWLSIEHFLLQGTLARLSLQVGRLDRAVELLEASMNVYAQSRAWFMLLDVKNHYYLGTAYERSGWTTRAIEQYRIFLDIFKDAEPGIVEIEAARQRLSRLGGE